MATSQRARWISYSLIFLLLSFIIFLTTGCISSSNPGYSSVLTSISDQVKTEESIEAIKTSQEDENHDIVEIPITPTVSIALETTEESLEIDEPLIDNLFIETFGFPIPETGSRQIESSYRFGSTLFGERIPHDGVEILNPSGTPVLAVADGIVYFSGDDSTKKWGRFTNFYGNFIIIKHQIPGISDAIFTLYAHLSELLVTEDETVTQGQTIGLVGATGKAFTNHLHFEVRVVDVHLQNARNPELYLPLLPSEEQPEVGILIGSLISSKGVPIPGVTVVIQKVIDGKQQPGPSIYVETYAKGISGDGNWNENFVVSNLPVGEYRVSAFAYQHLVEEFIKIEANEFIFVTLQPEE